MIGVLKQAEVGVPVAEVILPLRFVGVHPLRFGAGAGEVLAHGLLSRDIKSSDPKAVAELRRKILEIASRRQDQGAIRMGQRSIF